MRHLAIAGGTPTRTAPFAAWPEFDSREIAGLIDTLQSRRWGGYPEPGPRAGAFGDRFAAYQGSTHGITMCNGTVTLEVALRSLEIGWGDEVIMPAVTFIATATATVAAGAVPVFVDVSGDTLTLDPDAVEAAITSRTKAIMPVHLGHQMANMDRLVAIAQKHSLALIEDAAHAHGQRWRGVGAGCFGDFGSFSHEASKTLTAGEGGTLITNDERLAHRAHAIIDCGRDKGGGSEEATVGYNYRISEFQAAVLLAALERLPEQQRQRAASAREFQRIMHSAPGFQLMPPDSRITRWNFWRYIVLVEPSAFPDRVGNTEISRALVAEGIPCSPGLPPINRNPMFLPFRSKLPVFVEYRHRLDPHRMHFPVSEEMAGRRTIYLNECIFRSGDGGLRDVAAAFSKVQRYASELAR